jgi:hypothetical protein
MNPHESDPSFVDWATFFGPGDLADTIPVKEWDTQMLADLRRTLDDFLFQTGMVERPRGPIVLSEGGTVSPPPPSGPIEQPPPPPPPPPGVPRVPLGPPPRVIPCDNVIIDESDGGNGPPPGGGIPPGGGVPGRIPGGKIIEIPPGLNNCVFTQHHQTDSGEGWTVIVRIQNGRMGQVVVIDEKGNQKQLSVSVGEIIKVHKDNNKITVVGKRRVCTYFIKTNQLVCVPPL